MGNNPILHNDENGDIFGIDNLIGAGVGIVVEIGTQMTVNALTNKPLLDLDVSDIAVEAAVGFATSGIGNIAKAGKTAQRLVKAANTASKVVNSNKALKTTVKAVSKTSSAIAKVEKKTGVIKNTVKSTVDIKKDGVHHIYADGKLDKSNSDASIDFIAGIAGDKISKVTNILVTDKTVRATVKATTQAKRGITGTVAQKGYATQATKLKVKGHVQSASSSTFIGVASGARAQDVKDKISNKTK